MSRPVFGQFCYVRDVNLVYQPNSRMIFVFYDKIADFLNISENIWFLISF